MQRFRKGYRKITGYIGDVRKVNHVKIQVWTNDGAYQEVDTDTVHKADEFWKKLKLGMI